MSCIKRKHIYILAVMIRGGSWELAGNCVGCPIDGLVGLWGGHFPHLPMDICP